MIGAIGVPLTIMTVIAYQFLVESPRYLISRNKFDEARYIFKYISVYNLRPPFEYNLLQEMDKFNGIMSRRKYKKQS